jgi:hypothetical protein
VVCWGEGRGNGGEGQWTLDAGRCTAWQRNDMRRRGWSPLSHSQDSTRRFDSPPLVGLLQATCTLAHIRFYRWTAHCTHRDARRFAWRFAGACGGRARTYLRRDKASATACKGGAVWSRRALKRTFQETRRFCSRRHARTLHTRRCCVPC